MVRDVSTHEESEAVYDQEDHKARISFWDSWKLPGVVLCAFSYGGVKLLNYGMRMWMPYYLAENFQMEMGHIALLLTTYNVGGMAGSVLGGWLSDVYGRRMATVGSMLICSIPVMVLFRMVTSDNEFLFYIFIPLVGCMISGVANLMSTAVSADLSQDMDSHSHKEAKTTVIGIVNGTGSLGAAFGQVIIGWLQTFSWNWVFAFLVGKELYSGRPLFLRNVSPDDLPRRGEKEIHEL
jgi:OPA family glycerol-3-phosphate transporter-like MFS transporter 3